MTAYDVIVIGAGPGGYLAAERAGQSGLKALLIEKQHIGGTCLNEGCIPTKTLLHSAKLLHAAGSGKPYAVSCEGASIDHTAVVDRKRAVTSALVAGVKGGLRASKVKTVEAAAVIKGRDADGFTVEAAGETYKGKYLILATGSHPIVPNIEGLKESLTDGFVLTSTGLLEIDRVPASLCVVGGGVIGLEMATYFAMAGCKVEIVEAAGKVAGSLDAEATEIIQKSCEELGMSFRLNTRAVSFQNGKVTVERDGKREEIECEKALICIGRAANIEGYGLETLHVPTEKGAIKVDEHCMTGVPGVYAIGDCTGKLMLAHAAMAMGEAAAENAMGGDRCFNAQESPSCAYVGPEFAGVGYTEEKAKELGIKYKVGKFPTSGNGRSLVAGHTDGMIKILAGEKYGEILGVHILAPSATELIEEAALAIKLEATLDEFTSTIHCHPTVAEAVRECGLNADKKAIHIPNKK